MTTTRAAHIGTVTKIDHSVHTSIQFGSPVSEWDVVTIWRRCKKLPHGESVATLRLDIFSLECGVLYGVPRRGRAMIVRLHAMFRGGTVSTSHLRRLVKAQTVEGMWKEVIHPSPCQYGANNAKLSNHARSARVLAYEQEIMVILDEALALSEVRIREMEWQEAGLKSQLAAFKVEGVKALPQRWTTWREYRRAVKDLEDANKIQRLLRGIAAYALYVFAPPESGLEPEPLAT
ncbi:hypothetical protein C8Q76DRAFT_708066 [Earliella scabrosa]|nr:hypothetical protein C8Q76DRAFT_708066 [Earliella scabrosa]